MRGEANWCQVQVAACGTTDSAAPAEETISIGELAEEFRITVRALRFYEARGLLSPQRSGGERRYGQDARDRMVFILQAKRLGFTVREIRELLTSRDCQSGALNLSRRECTEQINLLERQKRQIDAALAELRRVYSDHYVRLLNRGDVQG